jgi:hypothetical protein
VEEEENVFGVVMTKPMTFDSFSKINRIWSPFDLLGFGQVDSASGQH